MLDYADKNDMACNVLALAAMQTCMVIASDRAHGGKSREKRLCREVQDHADAIIMIREHL